LTPAAMPANPPPTVATTGVVAVTCRPQRTR
jgi:hypothetical protein